MTPGWVVTTTVDAVTKAVLANLDTGQESADPDNFGEFAMGQEWYGALGVVARAKPPGKMKDGKTAVHLEAIAVRKGDGMAPIAVRDLRLNELYQPPEAGVALVGYGGAYDANEPTFDGAGNPASSVRKIYVPYAFVGGSATKAHVITIDGGSEEITLVHGDGTTVAIKAGKVHLGASSGTQPVAIAPNVTSYLSALESLLGTLAAAIDTRAGPPILPTPMATLVTTFVGAQAATKTAMAATKVEAV